MKRKKIEFEKWLAKIILTYPKIIDGQIDGKINEEKR